MFRENNIDFESVDYFIAPLSEDRLRSLFRKTGLRPIDAVRRADPAFKELGLTLKTPDEEIIAAIARFPGLLQRPIVEVGDHAVVARPIEKALELCATHTAE